MRARGLALALLLSACTGAVERPVSSRAFTAADSARVDSILAPLVADHAFMGAVAFVRDGALVYAQGAGWADVATGRAFTPATPADGGSLAKTLTAAAVWTLVHEGRLAIDSAVTVYLPEYPHAGTTVRELIAHTNGLPPYYEAFDPHFGPTELRTTGALLEVVRREMPAARFTPGTRFEYSNLGFDVAALVVERVTQQPIATFFRDRYFTPLAMDSAFARPGRLADFPGARTLGYRWEDTAWVVADVFDNEAFIGGSNVYFSALDLARWAGAHATDSALPAAVRTLGTPRPVIAAQPSPINGLSWYCDESGVRCQYTGAINAFHSLAYWDRTRREAVVMVSNSNLAPWTLITLQRALVSALTGRAPDTTPPPAFVSVDPRERDALAGRYVVPNGETITVRHSRDGLTLRIENGLTFEVFQVSPEAFYVPGLDYFVGFSGEASARRMHVRSMFVDDVALGTRPR